MPFCGYNEKMSGGIKQLLEGFVESIDEKNRGITMAFCGYNKKMSDGMQQLLEGLVEYGLVERSKLKSRTIPESLSVELSDLDRLLTETGSLTDSAKKEITEGVAKLAKGFYSLVTSENISDYKKIVSGVDSYFWNMDKKYYPELERMKESGDLTDMRKLVDYLNTTSLRGD